MKKINRFIAILIHPNNVFQKLFQFSFSRFSFHWKCYHNIRILKENFDFKKDTTYKGIFIFCFSETKEEILELQLQLMALYKLDTTTVHCFYFEPKLQKTHQISNVEKIKINILKTPIDIGMLQKIIREKIKFCRSSLYKINK